MNMWDWLEIEPTSDISAIKKAYSEAAKKYHPAEHPEEFRQLRDSYKKAMEYAKGCNEGTTTSPYIEEHLARQASPQYHNQKEEFERSEIIRNQSSEGYKKERTLDFGKMYDANNSLDHDKNDNLKFDQIAGAPNPLNRTDEQESLKFDDIAGAPNPLNRTDEQESLKFDDIAGAPNPLSRTDEKESLRFDNIANAPNPLIHKEDDEHDELSFDQVGNRAEEPEKPGLDFSKIDGIDRLSERQSRMLYFAGEMLLAASAFPEKYGCKEVMDAIFFNWDKEPYAGEITTTFIEAFLDMLGAVNGLDPQAVSVIEKVLFGNKSGNGYDELRARFKASLIEDSNVKRYKTKAELKDITSFILKYADSQTHSISFEYIIPIGKIRPMHKGTVYPVRNILLFEGMHHEYYFIEDLTMKVNGKTDEITIYDTNNKVILRVSSVHTDYQFIYSHLVRHGCRVIGGENINIKTFISPLDKIGKVFDHFTDRAKVFVISFIAMSLLISLASITVNLSDFANPLIQAIRWIILFVTIFIVWIPVALSVIAGLSTIGYMISLLFVLPVLGELIRDVRNGDAVYERGAGVYIFKRYIVTVAGSHYQIIPIEKILHLNLTQPESPDKKATLICSTTTGISKRFFAGLYTPAMAVYQILDERVSAIKEQLLSPSLERKYEKLKKRKIRPFLSPFLLDRNMRDTYQMAAVVIPIAIAASVIVIYDYTSNAPGGALNTLFYRELVAAVAFCIVGILSLIPIWSFRRYSSELLINVGIQCKHMPSYYNKVYGIYVLRDYFVSIDHWMFTIIPYSDIVAIGKEVIDGKSVIRIQTTDKKEYLWGNNKSVDARINAENINAILGHYVELTKKSA